MKLVMRQQKQELEKEKKRVIRGAKRTLAKKVKAMVYDVHFYLLSHTPVYTGRAVANFQWSMDNPAGGVLSPAPYKRGTLGKTSKMPLGAEPARAANEDIATGTLLSLDFSDPFRRIYVVNNTPYFPLIEYGTYGSVTGTKPRTPPGGIFRGAAVMMRAKHPGVRLRGTL